MCLNDSPILFLWKVCDWLRVSCIYKTVARIWTRHHHSEYSYWGGKSSEQLSRVYTHHTQIFYNKNWLVHLVYIILNDLGVSCPRNCDLLENYIQGTQHFKHFWGIWCQYFDFQAHQQQHKCTLLIYFQSIMGEKKTTQF